MRGSRRPILSILFALWAAMLLSCAANSKAALESFASPKKKFAWFYYNDGARCDMTMGYAGETSPAKWRNLFRDHPSLVRDPATVWAVRALMTCWMSSYRDKHLDLALVAVEAGVPLSVDYVFDNRPCTDPHLSGNCLDWSNSPPGKLWQAHLNTDWHRQDWLYLWVRAYLNNLGTNNPKGLKEGNKLLDALLLAGAGPLTHEATLRGLIRAIASSEDKEHPGLAVLLRLTKAGAPFDAAIYDQVKEHFPKALLAAMDARIAADPTLQKKLSPQGLADRCFRRGHLSYAGHLACAQIGSENLDAQCKSNVSWSCILLGMFYLDTNPKPDAARARAAFADACRMQNAVGCRMAGFQHYWHSKKLNAAAVVEEKLAGLQSFERACAMGDELSCSEAGAARYKEEGREHERRKKERRVLAQALRAAQKERERLRLEQEEKTRTAQQQQQKARTAQEQERKAQTAFLLECTSEAGASLASTAYCECGLKWYLRRYKTFSTDYTFKDGDLMLLHAECYIPQVQPRVTKAPNYLKPYAKGESSGRYAMWGGEYLSNIGNVYLKITDGKVVGNWKNATLEGTIVEIRGTFQIEYTWETPHTGEKGTGIFAPSALSPKMLLGSFRFTAVGKGTVPKGNYDWSITLSGK